MVGRGGFEPPKAEPTDLQSVPFGHSGISPASGGINPLLCKLAIEKPRPNRSHPSPIPYKIKKAGIGTAIPDRLITNWHLNSLSYAHSRIKWKRISYFLFAICAIKKRIKIFWQEAPNFPLQLAGITLSWKLKEGQVFLRVYPLFPHYAHFLFKTA